MIDLPFDRKIEVALFGTSTDVSPPASASDVTTLDKLFLQADTAKDPWREIARGAGWESKFRRAIVETELDLRFSNVDWDPEWISHFFNLTMFSLAIIQFGKCFYAHNATMIECHTDKSGGCHLTVTVRGHSTLR